MNLFHYKKLSPRTSHNSYRNLLLHTINYCPRTNSYYSLGKELKLNFDCINKSTIVVFAPKGYSGVYVFHAGQACNQHYYLDTSKFDKYDSCEPELFWTELSIEDKKPLRFSSAGIYDTKIFITGGCQNSVTTKEGYVFDTEQHTMTQLNNLNYARENHSTYVCDRDKYLYVFSGGDRTKNVCIQSIERLDLNNIEDFWQLIVVDRREHLILGSCLVIRPEQQEYQNKFILLGGSATSDSSCENSSVGLEISKGENELYAYTYGSTYGISPEDSFNNRVGAPNRYFEIKDKINVNSHGGQVEITNRRIYAIGSSKRVYQIAANS